MIMKLTYNETFLYLHQLAEAKGLQLTFATKDFFYSLANYCEKKGYYDYEQDCFCVEGSFKNFMNEFDIKSITVVQEAVKSLEKLGILRLIASPPQPTLYLLDFPYIELVKEKE